MKKQLLLGLMLIVATQTFASENNQKPLSLESALILAPVMILGCWQTASWIEDAVLSYRGYVYYDGNVYTNGWYKKQYHFLNMNQQPYKKLF